jgi:hypothetical protein
VSDFLHNQFQQQASALQAEERPFGVYGNFRSFSIRPADVKRDPASHSYARPAVNRPAPIPLFGRGHSFAPALHKPELPRAGGIKDGAATTKVACP